jgi:hypothetical protein
MGARHSQIARLDSATYSRHLLGEGLPHPKGFTPTPFSTLYVLLYNLLRLWKVKCGD